MQADSDIKKVNIIKKKPIEKGNDNLQSFLKTLQNVVPPDVLKKVTD